MQPCLITLLHTEVEAAFEGRGHGSRLIAEALVDVRRLPVLPVRALVPPAPPDHGLRVVG